jgi:hypothetical protein
VEWVSERDVLINGTLGRASNRGGRNDAQRVAPAAVPDPSDLYAPMDGAFHRIAKMTASVFEAPIAARAAEAGPTMSPTVGRGGADDAGSR